MTKQDLINNIKRKKSFLCVGLDSDLQKIPPHLLDTEDPIFEFNKAIIESTSDLVVAYKPNLAFYEALGPKGLMSLQKTMEIIPEDVFTIADAKRGDIGNTSRYYAKAFFEGMNFDSITVAPYMGHDSVLPFLEFEEKWVILLGLTSNEGALDFQFFGDSEEMLFEKVISKAREWGNENNLMFVVGATRGETLAKARKAAGEHFMLIPGIGAQGGSLEDVCTHAFTNEVGILVNSSRGVIYAGNGPEFASEARKAAMDLQKEMESVLIERGII